MKKISKIFLVLAITLCSVLATTFTNVKAGVEPFCILNNKTLYKGNGDSKFEFTLYNGDYRRAKFNFYIYDEDLDQIARLTNHVIYGSYASQNFTLTWDTSDVPTGTYYIEVESYYYSNYGYGYLTSDNSPQVYTIELKKYVAPTSVKMSVPSKNLKVGGSWALMATVSPSNATERSVTWSSSDTSVATVSSSGIVDAVGPGTATITAKTANGKKATCTIRVVSEEFPFWDVSSSAWYYNTIKETYELGLMTGTVDYKFEPNTEISRAMVATVLYRMEGAPNVQYKAKFNDVKSGEWYSVSVTWASEKGIVKGYDNGGFGPNDNITRQDLIVMLRNYAKAKGYKTEVNTDLSKYSDTNKISAYAKPAIQWAVSKGLVGSDSKLNPIGKATRAEAAKMFLQLYKMMQ